MESEEVVRRALLASNRGDAKAFLGCLHPEVEWESAGLFLYPARVWRGHAELKKGFAVRVRRHGGHPQVTLAEIARHEKFVFVGGTLELPEARPPVRLPEAWIFELRDGLILRAQGYTNQRRARTAWDRIVDAAS